MNHDFLRAARRAGFFLVVTLLLPAGAAWAQLRAGDILYTEVKAFESTYLEAVTPAGQRTGFSVPIPANVADLQTGPGGAIFVAYDNISGSTIARVNPATGALTPVVSEAGVWDFEGLALESSGTLLATQLGSVLRIDPATGGRTTVANLGVPLYDVEVGPGGSIYVMAGDTDQRLVEFNPVTGAQRVVSTDPRLSHDRGFAVSPLGIFIPVSAPDGGIHGRQQVLRIDPATGTATTLYDAPRTEQDYPQVFELAIEDGLNLLGADSGHPTTGPRVPADGRVVRFDALTGARTTVLEDTFGEDRLLNVVRVAVFVPEPAAAVALAPLCTLLLARRRRAS